MKRTRGNTKRYPWENVSLYNRAVWKLRKLTGHNVRFRVDENFMEVPSDMLGTFFENGDYYERNVCYWLERILTQSENKVFYDVGANYGYFCLKLTPKARYIYAFEPVSRTHEVLFRNITRNSLNNINLYKLGLSDKKASAKIHIYRSSGQNSLFLRSNLKVHPHFQVGQEIINLVTLDDLFQEEKLNPPDLIKIDIEGGELYALRGAREVIKKYQPILVMEYLDTEKTYQDAGYTRNDLLVELELHNYVIYGIPSELTDYSIYPKAKFSDVEVANIIALPKSMERFLMG